MRNKQMWNAIYFEAWSDPRFVKLAAMCRENVWYGIGAMSAIWKYCLENETDSLSELEAKQILNKRGLIDKIILVQLAKKRTSTTGEIELEISGMAKAIDKLLSNRKIHKANGTLGAEVKKQMASHGLANAKQTLKPSVSKGLSETEALLHLHQDLHLRSPELDPLDQKNLPTKKIHGERRSVEQVRRDFSPKLSTNEISDVVDSVLSENDFVESEVVKEKPKRKKKAISISDHDLDLGTRWITWTKKLSPHINANSESFAEAISELKRVLARTIPEGDLDGLLDALFNFVQKDDFWSKNCLSPRGLLKPSANGLRKVDNVITAMRKGEFKSKRKELLLETEEATDWSKYV